MKMKGFNIALLGLTTGLMSMSAFAAKPVDGDGNYNGNGAPSGPHYNLNIIGVENPKNADMTGSNRHTIFMPLRTSGYNKPTSTNNGVQIEGQIWLTAGEWFEVCDGNGFDEANLGDCDDINWDTVWNITDGVVSTKKGAVFALPCNTNLSGYWDSDGDGRIETNGQDDEVVIIDCNMTVDTTTGEEVPVDETDIVPTAHYQVWARALGKPDGSATVTTCATVQGELQCSLENTVLARATGKSLFTDVTNQLTSLVVEYCWEYDGDECIDLRTTRVALFAGDTQDWFWNYANDGLRLAQLRFYEVPQPE